MPSTKPIYAGQDCSNRMFVVALTGGIGCGKTSVSGLFAGMGVPIIDADLLAREQVAPGSQALIEIRTLFGEDILNTDGTLNRSKLKALIFKNPELRKQLEQILHPRILREMKRRISELNTAYTILVIPLLLEAHQTDLANRILVVDCPESLQIERIRERDDISDAQIRQILAAQVDRQSRLAVADDVITNTGTPKELAETIEGLHRKYLRLAEEAG